MKIVPRHSLVQSTAEHLRAGFQSGRWRGLLPGVRTLAVDLAVSKDTVRAALKQLEDDGTLKPQGSGKRRQIITSRRAAARDRSLRIGILLPIPLHQDNTHTHRLMLRIVNAIEGAGHSCMMVVQPVLPTSRQHHRSLAKLVTETAADAWLVYSAPAEVLTWFSLQPLPTLALGGRFEGLPLASSRTDLTEAMHQCVDTLVSVGHKRIVLIAPEFWRRPLPNPTCQALLTRLAHHGLPSSEYNLPAWEETPEGLAAVFTALFFATPPTALLLADPSYSSAARAWLGEHNRLVPQDVSFVNILHDPVFHLHHPPYATFDWPETGHLRRIQRWLKNLVTGHSDHESFIAHATFIPGGTISVARHRSKPSGA